MIEYRPLTLLNHLACTVAFADQDELPHAVSVN